LPYITLIKLNFILHVEWNQHELNCT